MLDWLLPSLAYVAAIGVLGITSKFALRTLPWQVVIVCAAIGFVVTAVVLLATGSGLTLEPAIGWALLAGVLAVCGLTFFNMALERGEASMVVPISASYPLAGTLMAAIVLSERITVGRVAGMILIVVGAVILGRAGSERQSEAEGHDFNPS